MRKHLKYTSLLVAVGMIGMSQVSRAEEKAAGSFWDNTKVTGSLDTSYNYNLNRPLNTGAGATSPYRLYDATTNSFNVNLVELAIENAPADWLTFRTDLDFGSDAKLNNTLEAFGAGTEIFNLQQAYASIKAPIGNGLTFKVGKFVTLHGAEVIESAYNSNSSRGLLFSYAIPITHTGIMANYAFNDQISLDLGVVNGWNNVSDINSGKSIHGMLTIKPFEKLTWLVGGTFGPENPGNDAKWRSLIDTTLTYAVNDQLSLSANYDWLRDRGLTGSSGVSDVQGIAAYINYKASDTCGLSLRGEYLRDDVNFALATTPSNKIYEGTLTTHYYFADGFDLRFEFRHDQGNNASFTKGSGSTRKFQDTIGSQLVYSF
ncbi:MAG: porin [Deltaproteobacteria bacterium]|nr:MAG: porin [Deltaproteobacteria bacterium]